MRQQNLLILISYMTVTPLSFSCTLDEYFDKSDIGITHKIELQEGDIDKSSTINSLLPEISLGVGQYINNNKRLSSIGDSRFFIGLSHDLMSLYRYKFKEDEHELKKRQLDLELNRKRNEFYLKLYSEIIDYRNKKERLKLMQNQLKTLKLDYEKVLFDMKAGIATNIEAELKNNLIMKKNNEINDLGGDIERQLKKIKKSYNLPEYLVNKITAYDIYSCKNKNITEITREIYKKKRDIIYTNSNIQKSMLLPSVYVSLGLTPKEGGELSNINFNHADYSASLSVSIPLVNFYSILDNKKQLALSLQKNNMELRGKVSDIEMLSDEMLDKKDYLIQKRELLIHELHLLTKKNKFINFRTSESTDRIFTKITTLEDIYAAEIEIKKIEGEISLIDLYLSFLG
ncbi:hypothetical protein YU66_004580 [Salmonella enterica subsp. enterica]|nr:hypothetical protein [Salmonella enterica subsp. enterica serovar Stanleyville]